MAGDAAVGSVCLRHKALGSNPSAVNRVWWSTPVLPALGRWKRKDQIIKFIFPLHSEIEVSPGYLRSLLKSQVPQGLVGLHGQEGERSKHLRGTATGPTRAQP